MIFKTKEEANKNRNFSQKTINEIYFRKDNKTQLIERNRDTTLTLLETDQHNLGYCERETPTESNRKR